MDHVGRFASPPSRTRVQDLYRYEHIRAQVYLTPKKGGLAQKQMLERICTLINDPVSRMSEDYERRVWQDLLDHVGMSVEDISRLLTDHQREKQAEIQRMQGLVATKASRATQNGELHEAIPGVNSPTQPSDPISQLLAEFNSKYCVVNESGKALVLEVRDDPVLARKQLIYSRFSDLKDLYSNRKIAVGAPPKVRLQDAATVWLDQEQRLGRASRTGKPPLLRP